MSIGKQLEQGAILTVVTLLGHGEIFTRIVDELKRVDAAMPSATSHDKRAKFIAECTIVFDDLIEPIIEADLRILLEIGLKYLAAEAVAIVA